MLGALLLVVMTQVLPCGPTELSPSCYCKQGVASACEVLVGDDARRAAEVLDEVVEALEALEALEQASRMVGEGDETKKKGLQAAEKALSQALGDTEPPNCKGQWHRKVDEEVIQWLKTYPKATAKQLMDKLREIYSRPEMKARFPNGF